MCTLQINLPEELSERIAARASESGYATPETYVESLLRADAGEDQNLDENLEKLLLERLDSGPSILITPEFIEQFKQQVELRRNSGKKRS